MDTQILQIDPAKLQAARAASELSLDEAALAAGIKRTSLSNYESGYARPQPHVLAALCRVYCIENPLELFTEVSSPDAFSKTVRHAPVLSK